MRRSREQDRNLVAGPFSPVQCQCCRVVDPGQFEVGNGGNTE